MSIQKYKIQIRRDTSANWTSANPTLLLAEMGYETDTGKFKFGDGATAWNTLNYNQASLDAITMTLSQLQTAISGSTLVPGSQYYISDRKIYLKAHSTNQIDRQGTYMYSAGKKAWGAFQITGTSGNISAIQIGTDSLLTATQTYTTTTQDTRFAESGFHFYVDISLNTLATNIAANINANGAINTKYKAYAVSNYVVIQAIATGTTLNTSAINVTSSGLTITSVTSMQGGTVDLTIPLPYGCNYDAINDKLLSLYDPVYNNEVIFDEKTVTADLTSFSTYLMDFNWNNALVINNKLTNCTIIHNFILAGSSNYTGVMAMIGNEFASSTFGQNLIIAGEISHNKGKVGNLYQNVVNSSVGGISGNQLTGMIDADYTVNLPADISYNYVVVDSINSNILLEGGSIRYCSITASGYGMVNNEVGYAAELWNVSGWTSFINNRLRRTGKLINFIATGYSVCTQNDFVGSTFANITFTGSVGVEFCEFILCGTHDYNNLQSSAMTWNNVHFQGVKWVLGYFYNSTLNYLWHLGGVGISFINLSLIGSSSEYIYVYGEGTPWGKFSLDVEIGFDSVSGVVGVLPIGSIIIAKTYVLGGYIIGTTPVTGGSLALGIDVDAPTGIMPVTPVSSFDNTMYVLNTPNPLPVTTVAMRNIIATISGSNITAGKLFIHLDFNCIS